MNATVIDIEEYKPHRVSQVICLKCYKRWISVRNENIRLYELECPQCKKSGYVIETGEILDGI